MKTAAVIGVVLGVALSIPAMSGAMSADQIITRMSEAHGGLEKWNAAPAIAFIDSWLVSGTEMAFRADIIVEQGSRRALLRFPDYDATIGWDGENAWSVNWQTPTPPRFYALLNWYFLNLPWVVHDPGVVLGNVGRAKIQNDPTEYYTVHISYESGVGDSPGDWYVLYVHPETYELRACDYVVTYPAVVPEGAETTPVHLLVFDSYATVDGFKVATHFTIYEEEKTLYTCDITNWSLSRTFDPAWVQMPEGAVVDRSMEVR